MATHTRVKGTIIIKDQRRRLQCNRLHPSENYSPFPLLILLKYIQLNFNYLWGHSFKTRVFSSCLLYFKWKAYQRHLHGLPDLLKCFLRWWQPVFTIETGWLVRTGTVLAAAARKVYQVEYRSYSRASNIPYLHMQMKLLKSYAATWLPFYYITEWLGFQNTSKNLWGSEACVLITKISEALPSLVFFLFLLLSLHDFMFDDE